MTPKSIAGVAACFALLVLAAFATPDARAGYSDFLSYYAGARLAFTPDLYSVSHVHAIQSRYATPKEVRTFTRVPFIAVLLWPLGQLPYFTSHLLWQALNLAAVAGFLWLWSPRPTFVPLCCFYFPMWLSLASGQDVTLVLCAVSLGAWLLRRDRQFAAGLVFTLCSIKFHLFLLLPLLVVGRRMWRFGWGFAAGAAVQAAVSFWVAGWNWPLRYIALLRLNEEGEGSVGRMLNLNGLFHGWPHAKVWLAAASIAVALIAWRALRRLSLDRAVGVMLCGGLLIGLHAYMPDAVLLLPLFFSLAGVLGLGRTYLVTAAFGWLTLALATFSTAAIAQVGLVVLFVWAALFAPVRESTPAG